MPIYEYECKCCKARFDVKQNFLDEPIRTCPTCNGEVRRVLHPVGIVFKGKGFYTTDHGRGKSAVAPGAEEASGKHEAAKPESAKKEEKKEPAVAAATAESKSDS